MASNMSVPIVLGPSLDKGKWRDGAASRSNFVSVKYNLRPPSIGSSAPGYLHSPSKYDSHWLLEYDASGADENQHGSHSSVHGFIGAQTVAKDVDCVLVWDERKQCYILDRLASSFTFRIDRSHNKLTERAKTGLSMIDRSSSDRNQSSALGLNLSGVNDSTADAETNLDEDMADNEDFARELELGLEHISHDDEGKAKNSSEEGSEPLPTSQKLRTGLGLIDSSILRDDVITPRGSPYIDRPKSISDKWGGIKPDHTPSQSHLSFSASHAPTRSTPVVSPTSVTNSPRMTGLDSTLSSSNTWKPPPQRSNVAIAYDEEEEESDDEEEDEDEEDEEEEEGEDDDDLDDYARQLESSLQS